MVQADSFVVYVATNAVNGKVYVGKTERPLAVRWQVHCNRAKHGSKYPIHCAIRQYGVGAFMLAVLARSTSKQELAEAEKQWIAQMDCQAPKGYNLTPGGDGFTGRHSAETRKRIGDAARGKRRELSPEALRKMSEAARRPEALARLRNMRESRRGTPMSLSQRRLLSEVGVGRKLSAETCKKMSESRKGKPRPPEVIAKMSVANKKRWENASDESRQRQAAILLKMATNPSPEARLKMRAAKLGKPLSEEHRRKMSASRKVWAAAHPDQIASAQAAASAALKGKKRPDTSERNRATAHLRVGKKLNLSDSQIAARSERGRIAMAKLLEARWG